MIIALLIAQQFMIALLPYLSLRDPAIMKFIRNLINIFDFIVDFRSTLTLYKWVPIDVH